MPEKMLPIKLLKEVRSVVDQDIQMYYTSLTSVREELQVRLENW
jgi:hypothetical protein